MARGDSATAKPLKSRCPRRISPHVDCLDWTQWYAGNQPNRRVRTRTHGGVTGTACEGLPMSISDRQALDINIADYRAELHQ